jgi:hypothetical protein
MPYPNSYEFITTKGQAIYLRCQPYIRKYNACLSSIPSSLLYNSKKQYQIKYFLAKEIYSVTPVIIELKIDGLYAISYWHQINDLMSVANQEDEGPPLAVINILVSMLILSVVFYGLFVKITNKT